MQAAADGGSPRLLIFVSSGASNTARRRALRSRYLQMVRCAALVHGQATSSDSKPFLACSWFKYKSQLGPEQASQLSSGLTAELARCVDIVFLVARGSSHECLLQEAVSS